LNGGTCASEIECEMKITSAPTIEKVANLMVREPSLSRGSVAAISKLYRRARTRKTKKLPQG
jgi:hypothetical protein